MASTFFTLNSSLWITLFFNFSPYCRILFHYLLLCEVFIIFLFFEKFYLLVSWANKVRNLYCTKFVSRHLSQSFTKKCWVLYLFFRWRIFNFNYSFWLVFYFIFNCFSCIFLQLSLLLILWQRNIGKWK